ncbi:MAG TPA: hypothetical protein DCG16_00675, partial [Gemmatimonadetes bacterium]|nr:hypothetical protein [Gemmatimonadota bacterium]
MRLRSRVCRHGDGRRLRRSGSRGRGYSCFQGGRYGRPHDRGSGLKFVSTGGQSPAADLRAALTAGLAPDGGLYLPERIDPIDASLLAELNGQSFSAVSRAVAGHLLGSLIPAADLDRIVDTALNFEVPLVAQGDDVHLLELFHGPTLAFKDVALQLLGLLFE